MIIRGRRWHTSFGWGQLLLRAQHLAAGEGGMSSARQCPDEPAQHFTHDYLLRRRKNISRLLRASEGFSSFALKMP